MFDFVELFESRDFVNEVINNKDKYLIFEISENTPESLEIKCKQIMSRQAVGWKPLATKKIDFVNMYTRLYYMDRYRKN